MSEPATVERLEKHLGLFDVYAICTGAMFASGFFLLPGVAAANAGPAVIVAYALSAVLMIPGIYSIAELSSAMPRAGGAYFFIHRSLGPWMGTIGGIGTWFVLVLKSAFALLGMGAYLVIFLEIPMIPLAVALTVAFGVLNVLGAKETAWLQTALVVVLVGIMAYYVTQGLIHVGGQGFREVAERQLTPFMPFGATGLISTTGLVFISYAGLTKVAATAEETENLDRNLPLGMFLALGTVAAIYVGGVYIMVGTLDPAALHEDITPVATAGSVFLDWLPGPTELVLVVIAAIAAFASTGNAGILTASRYPLAMARDELVWSGFDRVGRFGTPTVGIVATCLLMIFSIVFLDVERLAKLGSAFLLLSFALVNLAVIIMRESKIEAYAPGYRSPLYPWMQVIGVVSMLGLIPLLGVFSGLFVLAIVVSSSVWYVFYARGRVAKRGAIFSLFSRLARLGDPGVDLELWRLLQERGTSDEDSYEELVARAIVRDLPDATTLEAAIDAVVPALADELGRAPEAIRRRMHTAGDKAVTPGGSVTAMFEVLLGDIEHPSLAIVRAPRGVRVGAWREYPGQDPTEESQQDERRRPRRQQDDDGSRVVTALIFLVSPEQQLTQHLRILAELATQVDEADFPLRWRLADGEHGLKEALLRHEYFVTIDVRPDGAARELAGSRIRDLRWTQNTLVALVRREDQTLFPRGGTRLREGDRVTVVGPPSEIEELFERYCRP